MKKQKEGGVNIGVVGLLGVVFVILKLLGFINWSWWLVTLPFWGGIVLVLLVIVMVYLFGLIKILLRK